MKNFKQFMGYSLASSFELETELLIVKRVHDIDFQVLQKAPDLNSKIQRMEQSFIKKL